MSDPITPAVTPAPPAAYNLTLPGKNAQRVTLMPGYGIITWQKTEKAVQKDDKGKETLVDVVTDVTDPPFSELCHGCKQDKVSALWYRDSPGFCFCLECVQANGIPE